MTVITPPSFLQAGSYSAEMVRRLISAEMADRGGIVYPGDLAVTQNGTPNMSVNVATGRIFVPGTEGTYQGLYLCDNQGTTNVTIAAADGTNPRYDFVVARVQDAAYSGATNSWSLAIKQGTPGAVPVEPTPDANSVVLARVTVGAGVTSITNANIADRRVTSTKGQAAALGGFTVTTSAARPTANLGEGVGIIETDTNRANLYNGSAWVGLGAYAAPPPQFFTGTVSAGTATGPTTFITQNSILVAPYPLTMVVRATFEHGFGGGATQARFSIDDEGGSNIIAFAPISLAGFITNHSAASQFETTALTAKKDYAAGATCGFRVTYHTDTGSVYIGCGVEVNFYPKVS